MNETGDGADPAAALFRELQDAWLVIGRQQVALLRAEQQLAELRRRLAELELEPA